RVSPSAGAAARRRAPPAAGAPSATTGTARKSRPRAWGPGDTGNTCTRRARGLEARNHRKLLQRVPYVIERRLPRVRVRRLPVPAQLRDRRRIHVGRGADAAGAAPTQGREQKRLAPGEHIEAAGLELLERRARVVPVAGAVLDGCDRARIAAGQQGAQR